jgi:hypothetical protein
VAFFWFPGHLSAQGHWDAKSAFGRKQSAGEETMSALFQSFQWQHESWAGLITDYVSNLRPSPNWLYLNAHYWPNDFPKIGSEVVHAAADLGLQTVWSTATISNNFKAQLKFRDVDRDMCALVDHCLNNTWMETNLTSRDMYDYFHFKPHVYKTMNQRLLSVLGIEI